jgi:hypothetical protein
MARLGYPQHHTGFEVSVRVRLPGRRFTDRIRFDHPILPDFANSHVPGIGRICIISGNLINFRCIANSWQRQQLPRLRPA